MENNVQMNSIFEVITAILKKIQVFRDMTPCSLIVTDVTEELISSTFKMVREERGRPKLEAARFLKRLKIFNSVKCVNPKKK